MINKVNVKTLKDNTVFELIKSGISSSEAISETNLIIKEVLKITSKDLLINDNFEINPKSLDKFFKIVNDRLKNRTPVQYLLNKAFFLSNEYYVDESVLIPRPETELLVEEVLKLCEEDKCYKIIDIGTGSGCIAISLAQKLKKAILYACDISTETLSVARKNAEILKVANKIQFFHSDIFSNIEITDFDVVVSNPPYIPVKDKETLQLEVQKHEPHLALFTEDSEGLNFYKKLSSEAFSRLKHNGIIAVEVGAGQAVSVSNLFLEQGFTDINIIKDLDNVERIVTGKKL